MPALEMIGLQVTTPGAAGLAMAAVVGNSLTIRNTKSRVRLLAQTFSQQAAAGLNRITSPLLHDTTVGITQTPVTGTCVTIINPIGQEIQAQDTLSVFRTGSAVAGDIETTALHVLYDSLPGTEARLIDSQELLARGEEMYCWNTSLVVTAAGGYTGSIAINATQDQFKANRDYAIIGAGIPGGVNGLAAIRLVGPDWGNLGIGIPNTAQEQDMGNRWFQILSRRFGCPLIPVMNSSNKGLTFMSGLANENGVTTPVTLVAVLLAPAGAGRHGRGGVESSNARNRRTGRFVSGGGSCG